MAFRLISHAKCPPGEFFYEQTEGIQKMFSRSPDIKIVAGRVFNFRFRNKLPRADFHQCLEDIDNYTVTRLKSDPAWCFNTEMSYGESHPPIGGGSCGTCNAPLPGQ